jgi:hypothetical protein
MVSKIKTLPQQAKEGALEKGDRETVADSPLAVSPMRPYSSSPQPRSVATSHMTRSTRSCTRRRSIPSRSRMSSPCSARWALSPSLRI